ncbi:ABC transporter substrate-binding protein [Legionella norrlandica]|uniref:ABC transporter substrate-binding protein n=1 Tax=Legionella norrlandica TaxID=1498499 RepID=A0A0A2STE3_9GAMM|nr:transporter substrate-binding domain-containing protein [Legionella norrlandica]KGP62991.1 ABC transporter substrate-binding protein [Legionella norrlandica]
MKRLMLFILFICNFYAYGKPLIIGVPEFAPPFVSTSSGGTVFYGFNIDLMNSICKIIRMECAYKGMNLQKLFTSLNTGEVDIVLAPTPIVPTYNSDYIFSIPYLPSNVQFVTLKSNNTINTVKDLKGKKIGVLKYTLYGGLLEDNFQNLFELVEFPKIADMATALTNQDIDAVVLNANVAKYALSNSTTELKLIGEEVPIGNGYGILSLKKNAPLIKEINSALLKIEENGTYLTIYNTYFGDGG